MPNISVFMVLELCGWLKICEPVVQYIAQDCVTKSMCRVPSTFIQSIYTTLSYPTLTVVSEDETALIIDTETTMGQLTSTSELYKLYFQHPSAPQCEKTNSFNIELVTEESEYPAGIHCHSEVISAAHMHVVIQWSGSGRWNNMCISWRGKPEFIRYTIDWGGERIFDDSRVRLAVFYDIQDKM